MKRTKLEADLQNYLNTLINRETQIVTIKQKQNGRKVDVILSNIFVNSDTWIANTFDLEYGLNQAAKEQVKSWVESTLSAYDYVRFSEPLE